MPTPAEIEAKAESACAALKAIGLNVTGYGWKRSKKDPDQVSFRFNADAVRPEPAPPQASSTADPTGLLARRFQEAA